MTGYDKVRKGYKWEVLALLWVAYLLNQADRQIFNVVLPLIREDLGLIARAKPRDIRSE